MGKSDGSDFKAVRILRKAVVWMGRQVYEEVEDGFRQPRQVVVKRESIEIKDELMAM
jgi:hypothetical protein